MLARGIVRTLGVSTRYGTRYTSTIGEEPELDDCEDYFSDEPEEYPSGIVTLMF
jgi:hypothetical protein